MTLCKINGRVAIDNCNITHAEILSTDAIEQETGKDTKLRVHFTDGKNIDFIGKDAARAIQRLSLSGGVAVDIGTIGDDDESDEFKAIVAAEFPPDDADAEADN